MCERSQRLCFTFFSGHLKDCLGHCCCVAYPERMRKMLVSTSVFQEEVCIAGTGKCSAVDIVEGDNMAVYCMNVLFFSFFVGCLKVCLSCH